MRFFFFIFLFLFAVGSPKTAYSSDSDDVRAELVFSSDCLDSSADKIKGAVKFTIPYGTHTYWKFAGQAGEPTDIRLSAEPAADFSDIEWQLPKIYNNFGFYEIIYSQKAWHFFDIIPHSKITEGNIKIDATVTFLQCSNVCEPRRVRLSESLPVCTTDSHKSYSFQSEYKLVATPQQEQEIMREYRLLTKGDAAADEEKNTSVANDTPSLMKTVEYHAQANPAEQSGIWYIILIAFLGGIILNLMPCVLPVVSIKLLSLTKARHKSIKKESLWYGFGVISSFLIVWLFISLVRAGGELVGWGFQLQNPAFVLFLFVLLLLLGMIFSGFIDVPPQMTHFVKGEQSAFASGILAVFLASPCIAPFMGTAIAYALTFGGIKAFSVFFFLGLGLAFPFVFLAFFNGWVKYLPKTKRWNVVLERVLALPLYISAIWLLGVIYAQTGGGGFAIALFLTVIMILAAFFRHRFLWFSLIATLAAGILLIKQGEKPNEFIPDEYIAWQEYSDEALSAAVFSGNPVFLDFTAKWCLTCMANERLVLERQSVAELFKEEKVIPMRADFTLKDEKIMRALQNYGATGVPLYVYYPKANENQPAEPVILPQILTFEKLKQTIKEEK